MSQNQHHEWRATVGCDMAANVLVVLPTYIHGIQCAAATATTSYGIEP